MVLPASPCLGLSMDSMDSLAVAEHIQNQETTVQFSVLDSVVPVVT